MSTPLGQQPRDRSFPPAQRRPRPSAHERAGPAEVEPGSAPRRSAAIRGRLVRWYAVAVLVLASGAFFALAGGRPDGESDPRVLAIWVLAYGAGAALLVDTLIRARGRVRLPPELLVFLVLALLSVLWSEAPALTLRRAIGLSGTAMVGIALAQRLGALGILHAVRRAVVIVAVASLALYVSGHPAALDSIHGTLRGVVATKNSLGFFTALGLLACVACAMLDPRSVRRCVASSLPIIVALALTDSKAGLINAAAVAALAVVLLAGRRRRGALAAGVVMLLLATLAAVTAPQISLAGGAELIGEDTTLTGRDAIWEEALAASSARPTLGYGYGAFWPGSEAAGRIRERLLWDVPHAHNGPLDVLLDLGVVGVLAAGAVLVGLVGRGLFDVRGRRYPSAALRLSLAALLLTQNLVESNLLQQNNLMTVLLVASLALDDRRSAPPARPRRPAYPRRIT